MIHRIANLSNSFPSDRNSDRECINRRPIGACLIHGVPTDQKYYFIFTLPAQPSTLKVVMYNHII